MALIACPECEKQMSDTAESCPDCGYKLTPEIVESIKKDETEKAEKEKQQQEAINKGCLIGGLIVLGIGILIGIIFVIAENNAERSAQRAREESDERIRQSVAERSKPKKEELEPLAHDDWVGTWYVESVDGDPTGLGSGSEIGLGDFHWWDWTFHADGRYESKMRQCSALSRRTRNILAKISIRRHHAATSSSHRRFVRVSVPSLLRWRPSRLFRATRLGRGAVPWARATSSSMTVRENATVSTWKRSLTATKRSRSVPTVVSRLPRWLSQGVCRLRCPRAARRPA